MHRNQKPTSMVTKHMNTIRAALLASLAIAAAATGSSATAAGYVNNRAGWYALTKEAKIGYAQGLNDSLNYVFTDDTLAEALIKRGRTLCLVEQKTTAAGLADQITSTYKDDRFANVAPTAIYILRMAEVCKTNINSVRLEYGLGPL